MNPAAARNSSLLVHVSADQPFTLTTVVFETGFITPVGSLTVRVTV
jgi:predicted metal-dependent enzyme (double-stranded beta helix superfamily)